MYLFNIYFLYTVLHVLINMLFYFSFILNILNLFLLLVVCTCVVHKRCHLEVVSQCPGEEQDSQEPFPADEKVFDVYNLFLINCL